MEMAEKNVFASSKSRFHHMDEDIVGFWSMSFVIEDRQREQIC